MRPPLIPTKQMRMLGLLALVCQWLTLDQTTAQDRGKDPTGTSEPSGSSDHDSPYFIEHQTKGCGWSSSFILREYVYNGTSIPAFGSGYYWSGPDIYGNQTTLTYSININDFNSDYLRNRIEQVPWFYYNHRLGKIPYSPDSLYDIRASAGSESLSNERNISYAGHISHSRFRLSASSPDHPPQNFSCYKLTMLHEENDLEVTAVEPITIELPTGEMETNWINLEVPLVENKVQRIILLPIHEAPEVLAVNSDFDEGRIDPVTGYAIPDCDDNELSLVAARDHLDGLFDEGELVKDDLHPGFFGVEPKYILPDFWKDANVTIRKIDKIDPDTGHPESGHIRMHAVWGPLQEERSRAIVPYDLETLVPVNLVTGGIPSAPGEGLYTMAPDGWSRFRHYIEGIHPGKITLEWRYQKGDIDIRHEQSFLVATQKSKQAWIHEVIYQVKLQASDLGSEIDLNDYDPANGFFLPNSNNYKYIQTVYYYYMQLFQQYPEKFYWAGMAKTAGASVYAGMVDMATWKTSVFVSNQDVDKVLIDFMIQGNKDIFMDMAWAHHAFAASGIEALDYIEENETDRITDFDAWGLVNDGIQENNIAKLSEGNELILRREQGVIMPPLYDTMKEVWLDPGTRLEQFLATDLAGIVYPPKNADGKINIDEMFSINSRNPVQYQLGPSLRQVVPNGKLSDFNHRWAWIDNPQNGMLQIWLGTSTSVPGFTVNERANLNGSNLTTHAKIYSMLPTLGGLRDNQFPPPPW